jgi:FG-GAP repeat/Thrombospondin type 3 repeat
MRTRWLLKISLLVVMMMFAGFVTSAYALSVIHTLDTPNPQTNSSFGGAIAIGRLDGDTKADIVVGAPWEDVGSNPDQGRAYVYSGANGSLLFPLDSPNPAYEGYFGAAVAIGDVNSDGRSDIAIGAPWEGQDGKGAVHVFSGLDGSLIRSLHMPAPDSGGLEYATFGISVAVGDVNDDGKGDVVVGAPHTLVGGNAEQGRVYVFSGADGAVLLTLDTPNPQADASFGASVAAGDANNDGRADIAVGALEEDTPPTIPDTGRAYLFSGAGGALLSTLVTPNPQEGARFGESVAMGDMNGDGKADVAVGAPMEDVGVHADQGRVYAFSGANGSFLFNMDLPTPGYGWLGESIAMGDANADGKSDIAAGAAADGVPVLSGRVHVFSGAGGAVVSDIQSPDPQNMAYFGSAVGMGDVDGDGMADVGVGEIWEDVGGVVDQGRAYVFAASVDSDGDGVPGTLDNCPVVYNTDQTNSDGGRRPNGPQILNDFASNPAQDTFGDACDPDNDNDGLPDISENELSCPYRLNADSDGDRIMDSYEASMSSNPCNASIKPPPCVTSTDSDTDGLTDCIERSGYNTCVSNGDAVPGWSACANASDSDGDGCADVLEVMDINGDRKVTIADQTLLAKRAVNIFPASDSDPIFDVNKSGTITVGDQTLMAKNTCLLKPGLIGCEGDQVCPAE